MAAEVDGAGPCPRWQHPGIGGCGHPAILHTWDARNRLRAECTVIGPGGPCGCPGLSTPRRVAAQARARTRGRVLPAPAGPGMIRRPPPPKE